MRDLIYTIATAVAMFTGFGLACVAIPALMFWSPRIRRAAAKIERRMPRPDYFL